MTADAQIAARKAQALLDASRPADHPYPVRKQIVLPDSIREIDLADAIKIIGYAPKGKTGPLAGPLLVVPILIDGELSTVQLIDGSGGKHYLAGGRTGGGYHPTSSLPDCDWGGDLQIAIGEGVATVVSVTMACPGCIGVAAMSCGNLTAVGKMLRERYPEAKIIYLGDVGLGAKKCMEAARATGGLVAVPPIDTDGGDWNDVHVRAGLVAVAAGIDAAQSPAAETVDAEVVSPDSHRRARSYALTETGGAELLAARLAGDWHYIPERDKWIYWDGQRWTFDVGGVRLMERSKLVAHEFLAEAQQAVREDDARAKVFAQFAATAQRRNTRANFIALAKSEPGIAVPFSQFDVDHYLLNVANGTIDLRTGRLGPPRRDDKITRVLPWAYDSKAACLRWERFLAEVLPDVETVAFVQKLVGYCLTGATSEHIVVFCFGPGANGKTVFVNALLRALGEYATQAPTSMLIASQGERHPTELVTLHGRRLVVCAEVPGGKAWNEELIKSISGGDVISARGMREDFWTFATTHKMVICGNHKPVVRGQDEGIWRRWRLIPFGRTIPEADRDPKLAEKLADEMPGILAWAVRGCLAWQRDGLKPSAKVVAATADYRTESDRLAPFIDERCTVERGATVLRADLFRAYTGWAQEQGEKHPLSDRAFAELVRGRGIEECWIRKNGKQPRAWRGIELVTAGDYIKPPVLGVNGQTSFSGEINRKDGGNVQSPAVTPQTESEDWS